VAGPSCSTRCSPARRVCVVTDWTVALTGVNALQV
jgi:hypothetical protein